MDNYSKQKWENANFIVKNYEKMQFVLCELHFLCYTITDNNHGGICENVKM